MFKGLNRQYTTTALFNGPKAKAILSNTLRQAKEAAKDGTKKAKEVAKEATSKTTDAIDECCSKAKKAIGSAALHLAEYCE